MTPDELKAEMVRVGWSRVALANALNIDRSTLYRYLLGLSPIPHTVELSIEHLKSKLKTRAKASRKVQDGRNGIDRRG